MGVRQIWSWADGSNSTDFTNWKQGYPDDNFSDMPQCVTMDSSGNWTNVECFNDYSSQCICKSDKSKFDQVPSSLVVTFDISVFSTPPPAPTANPPRDSGLSGGATAVITICSLLAVSGSVVFFIVLRQKNYELRKLLGLRTTNAQRPNRQTLNLNVDNVAYNVT